MKAKLIQAPLCGDRKRDKRNNMKRILSILLSMAMVLTYVPALVFADDEPAGDEVIIEDTAAAEEDLPDEDVTAGEEMTGSEDVGFTEGLPDDALDDIDMGSEDELLEGYMLKEAGGNEAVSLEKSSRAWKMTGRNLVYYNNVKSLAEKIASGSQRNTIAKFSGTQVLSKTKFTAAELGLSRVAKMSGGRLVLTDEAKKKINMLMAPEDWTYVMMAALLDMPYELYWYNRIDGSNCVWSVNWHASFTKTTLTISTDTSKTYCEVMLPLISDYAVNMGDQYYRYIANTGKTKAVASAIENAKAIVSKHAGESDCSKLKSYLEEVCDLTEYNYDAYYKSQDPRYETYQVYNSPWQMIDVFDGDPSTNVICAGYGKAYKFLCDISDFRSSWIECQTMYGTIGTVENGTETDPGSHLWCTVRMNDGKNYIVDPTWYDGSDGYYMFLQGGKSGNGYCDVETYLKNAPSYKATLRYTTGDWMDELFSDEELAIASGDYSSGHDSAGYDAPIDISSARITGKSLTFTGAPLTDEHPVVLFEGKTLKEGVDYLVTDFSDNMNVGKASFVITGIGQFRGSKSGTFSIVPKNTAKFSLKKGSRSIKVSWAKRSLKMSKARITGYQIQYSTSRTFKSGNKSVKVKGYRSVSKTIKGLKAKKTYYVRIRTYMTTGGKTYYSEWSSGKSVKTK